jgi:hypothetical protein
MTMTLNQYCAAFYDAHVLHRGKPADAVTALQAAMATDATLKSAAVSKLLGLSDDVCDRDFVSKVYREFLRRALA